MNRRLKDYKVKRFSAFVKKSCFNFNFLNKFTSEVLVPFTINLPDTEYNELTTFLHTFFNDLIQYVKQETYEIYLWQVYVFHINNGGFDFVVISLNGYNAEVFNDFKKLKKTNIIAYQVVADRHSVSAQKVSSLLAKNISVMSRFFERQLIDIAIQN